MVDGGMESTVRTKARGFTETLLKFETVLTAQIFLRIYHRTSPLSKYLQTQGMGILSAQSLVEGTEQNLKQCVRNFEADKGAADLFVNWVNKKL